MRKILLCGWMAFGLTLVSGAALAAPVLRVIVVDTRDLKSYLHEVEQLRAEYKKAGLQVTLRAWRATFAGADAGSVVVSEEVPDLATLAKVQELAKSNAEVSATMQRIGALRHIDSDSLFEELTP